MLPRYNGEFYFELTEKVDRDGNTYLFGGVQLFNAVVFVRPDTKKGEGERWIMSVRPYVKSRGKDQYEDTWNDTE